MENEKIRFAAVGVVNTAVDFVILFSLASLFGVPSVFANVISTSAALAVSYLLNKKAVFKNTDTHNFRQVVLFIVVTLSGLWILQGLIISLTSGLLETQLGVSETAALLIAKLVATCFSLVWNFMWYSRVVFRKENISK